MCGPARQSARTRTGFLDFSPYGARKLPVRAHVTVPSVVRETDQVIYSWTYPKGNGWITFLRFEPWTIWGHLKMMYNFFFFEIVPSLDYVNDCDSRDHEDRAGFRHVVGPGQTKLWGPPISWKCIFFIEATKLSSVSKMAPCVLPFRSKWILGMWGPGSDLPLGVQHVFLSRCLWLF